MDYFISDSHFGHRNIIKYCNRPWSTSEEMDDGMIQCWNSVVRQDDRVFVVGDMFLCDEDAAKDIMSRLNGYKILIAGNHDSRESKMLRIGFNEYHRELTYCLGDMGTALMKHYPQPDKVTTEGGYDYLIHGHIHVPPHRDGLKINVAADLIDFTPVSRDYVLDSLRGSASNSDNEIINFEASDEKIKLSIEIRSEDFSGTIDHIYKLLRKQWRSK